MLSPVRIAINMLCHAAVSCLAAPAWCVLHHAIAWHDEHQQRQSLTQCRQTLQGLYSWSADAAVQNVSRHLYTLPATSNARLVQPLVPDVLHTGGWKCHSQGRALLRIPAACQHGAWQESWTVHTIGQEPVCAAHVL